MQILLVWQHKKHKNNVSIEELCMDFFQIPGTVGKWTYKEGEEEHLDVVTGKLVVDVLLQMQ